MRLRPAVFFLAATGCVSNAPPPIPLNPVRFLLISDLSTADTLPDGRGGLARVATVRRRLTEHGPAIFVLAGNALSSDPSDSRRMIEALNQAKLDYATFGNREFELPYDTLVARVAESKFKWLSSNCTRPDGSALPGVEPWDTIRVSGHKVGIFGLTLPGAYPSSVRCTNPDSAARRTIEALGSEEADLIVGLTHQLMSADRNLLGREPKLDLVLGGHERAAQDSVVSGRHAVKPDSSARNAQFVTLWGGKGNWRQAVGLVPIDGSIPGDTAVARIVRGQQVP